MQDYYNYVPLFGAGGRMFKEIVSNFTAKGIRNLGNVVGKDNKELSTLLSKLAKSKSGGGKLSSEESKKLVDMLQNFRRNTPAYQARRKSFLEQLAKKKATGKEAPEKTAALETSNKAASPSIKSEVGNTLSARWKLARTWMNNHPKLTVGVPLLALGTGPGRYITGNAIKATQSDPANWFGEQPLQAAGALDYIMMPNGTKIPIKKSSEGYFVPVLANSQPATSTDDLDTIIAEANNTPSNPVVPSQPGDPGYIDTSTINDLFPEDQW